MLHKSQPAETVNIHGVEIEMIWCSLAALHYKIILIKHMHEKGLLANDCKSLHFQLQQHATLYFVSEYGRRQQKLQHGKIFCAISFIFYYFLFSLISLLFCVAVDADAPPCGYLHKTTLRKQCCLSYITSHFFPVPASKWLKGLCIFLVLVMT